MMDPGQSIILQSPYFKFFSKKRPYDGVEGPKIKGTWVAAHFALHLAIPCWTRQSQYISTYYLYDQLQYSYFYGSISQAV